MNKVLIVTRNHNIPLQSARSKACDVAKKMQSSLGISWSWCADMIKFDCPSGVGKGTSGTLEVTDRLIRVTVSMPLMISLMQGKLEAEINAELDACLVPR